MVLSVLNLAYWGVNLFGFLLPVAALRYMRAHFLCVEVEQVTTRTGMEEPLGSCRSFLSLPVRF
jgi:hypothetical protein